MKRRIFLGILIMGLAIPFSRAEESIDYLTIHAVDGSRLKSWSIDNIERILLTDDELVVKLDDNTTSTTLYSGFSKITFGSDGTSIEEIFEESSLAIVYLPADRAVSVVAAQPLVSVQVYNLQGHLVEQVAPQVTSVRLSLDDCPAGVYVVLARTSESVQIEKIIKY